MTLDDFFEIGVTVDLGSHTFDAAFIKSFATSFDPQPFHTDEEAAAETMFGALCASGWQTAAVWMKRNQATPMKPWTGDGPAPSFGPSPGLTKLKWLKPVYAGETITYTRKALSHRPMISRPGWHVLSVHADGSDSAGDKVIDFDCAILVKVA